MQVAKFPAHSKPQPSVHYLSPRNCVTWANALFLGASLSLRFTPPHRISVAVAGAVFPNCNATHKALEQNVQKPCLISFLGCHFHFLANLNSAQCSSHNEFHERIPFCP